MKIILRKYLFEKWWLPIVFFILVSIIYILSLANTNKITNQIIDSILILSLIILLIAAIWQLKSGTALKFVFQGVTLIGGFLGLSFITSFMMMFGPDTDTFAANLTVPINVEKDYPEDFSSSSQYQIDSIRNIIKPDKTFKLYNSFQPGLYEYDFWLKSNRSGTLYLKVFEVTKNVELSSSRLKERSSVNIESTNNEVVRFGTKKHFTIYEGDWGKPYLARFELWFNPNDAGGEFKVLEKNYVIEGWMR
jgi:hypothetical protein